jgi:hypothetical protein
MKKMFLLFSHTLTNEQIEDAKKSLGVGEFVSLSDDLQKLWSNIPPDITDLDSYLKPIKDWLQNRVNKDDYVLIQGDFGATCKMVAFVKEIGAKAVYATTKRDVQEKKIDGKIIKTSVFKHIIFREF